MKTNNKTNNNMINKLLDYLFPGSCACCGGKSERAVCGGCEYELLPSENLTAEKIKNGKKEMEMKTGADEVFFVYKYGDKKLTRAIFALKQKNNHALANYFAAKLSEKLESGLKFDIITNAPRSGGNKTAYGYDHAEMLARNLAALTDVKYKKCLVKKNTDVDQKTLNFEERKKNSEGKYTVTEKEMPRSVLIVDDVCTSGGTLKECINMLRRSGAETVFAAVIANRMK